MWKNDKQNVWQDFGFPALCFFSQPGFSAQLQTGVPSIPVFYHDLLLQKYFFFFPLVTEPGSNKEENAP